MAGTLIVSNITTDTNNTFIVRSNTGTTLFSANTTGIDVANSIGATAITNDKILSVANTKISGNIISSQITSVANTQISGNIISSQITSVANTQITGNITDTQLASTLDLSSKTLTLPSSSVREYLQSTAYTTDDRSLVGDSGWIDHLSITFTANQSCTVLCFANFAHGREDGPVNLAGRYILDGSTTSQEVQVFKQGLGSSYAFGAHSSFGFFTSVSAGSHTIKLQVRNSASGSTAVMNYFGQPGGTNHGDFFSVLYK
jgi:hypothetical protein